MVSLGMAIATSHALAMVSTMSRTLGKLLGVSKPEVPRETVGPETWKQGFLREKWRFTEEDS